MSQRIEVDLDSRADGVGSSAVADRDERLGEAIETYLELAESGHPPDPDGFASRFPDLAEELREALQGLDLVQELVGGGSVRSLIGESPASELQVPGYRIVGELGRGGMGVVYEAEHLGLQRRVALKVLGTHATPSSTSRRRFLNEARTAARLHHTHIVPVFDVGQTRGLCYYAMQMIEGSGLDRVVRQLRERAQMTMTDHASRIRVGMPEGASARDKKEASRRARESGLGVTSTRSWNRPASPSLEARGALLTSSSPSTDDSACVAVSAPSGAEYFHWVARVGWQAAEALGHAHQHGVVHRDVKPSNLLVQADGSVWVADFGLARQIDTDENLTGTCNVLGTPRYMSPEQIDNARAVDARSDVYSLGATLYELTTLRPPFEGQSATELSQQILHREPVAPRSLTPRIPRDLETIVLKALAKRQADRYRSGQEMAEDLARFLRGDSVRARRISPLGRAWRFAHRNPAITSICLTAATLIVLIVTIAYRQVSWERDKARGERDEAQHARGEAMATMAELIRRTNEPNRRERGLEKLREAAGLLRDDPEMRLQIRNEAVQLLTLRDLRPVENQPVPEGRVESLEFVDVGGSETLLSLTSESGLEPETYQGLLSYWPIDETGDLNALQGAPRIPLRSSSPWAISDRYDRWFTQWSEPLAVTRSVIAALDPHGSRVTWFHTESLQELTRWTIPDDRRILALWLAPDAHHLLSLELCGLEETSPAPEPNLRRRDRGRPRDRAGANEAVPTGMTLEVRLRDLDPLQLNWNSEPRAILARWPIEKQHDPRSWPRPLVAVDPDWTVVAVSRYDSDRIHLYDASTGQPHDVPPILGLIPTSNDPDGAQADPGVNNQFHLGSRVTALTLGPNRLLAAAGGGSIQLWELDSGVQWPMLINEDRRVRGLRFNAEGTMLAVLGYDTLIRLWDPVAQSVISTLPMPSWPLRLRFSGDGDRLTVLQSTLTDQPPIVSWGIERPQGVRQLSQWESTVESLDTRPGDGSLAVSLRDEDRPVQIWRRDAQGNLCPHPSPWITRDSRASSRGRQREPLLLGFDDRDRLLLIRSDRIQAFDPCPQGRYRDSTDLELDLTERGPFRERIAWSGDRSTLAILNGPPSEQVLLIRRSDLPDRAAVLDAPPCPVDPDGSESGPPRGPQTHWRWLGLGPSGDHLHLMSRGHYEVWDLVHGRGEVRLGSRRHRWSLRDRGLASRWQTDRTCLSPDGVWLAWVEPGTVRLVRTADGVTEATIDMPGGRGAATAALRSADFPERPSFSPDSTMLAVATGDRIGLWDLRGDVPQLWVQLPIRGGRVDQVIFGPDGDQLTVLKGKRTVEVWNLVEIRDALRRYGLESDQDPRFVRDARSTAKVGAAQDLSAILVGPPTSAPAAIGVGRRNASDQAFQEQLELADLHLDVEVVRQPVIDRDAEGTLVPVPLQLGGDSAVLDVPLSDPDLELLGLGTGVSEADVLDEGIELVQIRLPVGTLDEVAGIEGEGQAGHVLAEG